MKLSYERCRVFLLAGVVLCPRRCNNERCPKSTTDNAAANKIRQAGFFRERDALRGVEEDLPRVRIV